LGSTLLSQRTATKEELKETVTAYSKVIELDPTNTGGWYGRGMAYQRLGQLDNALADYSRALALAPDHVDFLSARAAVHAQMHQLDNALADFSKALALVPENLAALTGRAAVHAQMGQWDKAIADYSGALKVWPQWPDFLAGRARAFQMVGQYDKAAADAGKAIELDPKHSDAHNTLAWLLATCPDAKLRDPKRAVELARKATELASKVSNNWGTLGAAQYRGGDWKAAVAALEKARELSGGGDAYNWLFLAMAHRKLGNAPESRMAYDRAIEWLEKNKAQLEKNKMQAEELRRFRSEAEEVLELKK
jgi:tetratricopeptide (TPR) repeat protein